MVLQLLQCKQVFVVQERRGVEGDKPYSRGLSVFGAQCRDRMNVLWEQMLFSVCSGLCIQNLNMVRMINTTLGRKWSLEA